SNWWVPKTMFFAVDNQAETIPTSGDIGNSIEVACIKASPPPNPPPCQVPSARPTIDGIVKSSVSVDANANTPGDENAALTTTPPVFAADMPSASLPEGVRGEMLKVTGDTEAAGQIRMVLGSYAETLTVSGTTNFTVTFGGVTSSPVVMTDSP